jgi:hypothetical protein
MFSITFFKKITTYFLNYKFISYFCIKYTKMKTRNRIDQFMMSPATPAVTIIFIGTIQYSRVYKFI